MRRGASPPPRSSAARRWPSSSSEYAEFVGVDHCVGVANGTDALELALRAAGVGPGDEVIIPANTFIATAEAVSRIGAVPVLVDVDPDHLLIDPQPSRRRSPRAPRRSSRCTCSGRSRRWRDLLDLADAYGVRVVEDAAQSQGATRHGPAGRAASGWSRAPASTRARTSAPPATPAP